MTKVVLSVLLVLAMAGSAFGLDLSAPDKQKHMAVSAVLATGTGALALAEDSMSLTTGTLAFVTANMPGLFKEFADRETTGFDAEDLAANAIGSAAALLTLKLGYTVWVTPTSVGLSGRF